MGGIVSTGHNNDDLIDNLLEVDYIKSSMIERVFRAVDRAEYFLPDGRANAYKDLAWKCGNLHLSAPCIYSEVMEGLCLESGLAFLNLGSGTGYLSTMVGLILGKSGINHGVEIHEDVVQYANRKLEEFRKYSGAIDEYDFCEPKFVRGNCLCLTSDSHLYDRVYCGAACPPEYENYMKNLLKIGGILVMPLNDQLLQIKRQSETNWVIKNLLPVSFASLISPPEAHGEVVPPVDIQPLSLQAMARIVVRSILRKNIELELPPVATSKNNTKKKVPKKKRVLRKLIVPLFDTDSSSDEEGRDVFGDRGGVFRARVDFNADMNLFTHVISSFRRRQAPPRSDGSEEQSDSALSSNVVDKRLSRELEEQENMSRDEEMPEENRTAPASEIAQDGKSNTGDSLEVNDGSNDGKEKCTTAVNHQEDIEMAAASSVYQCDVNKPDAKKQKGRVKFDSGLGDEPDIMPVSPVASDDDDDLDGESKLYSSSSGCDGEAENRRVKRGSQLKTDSRNGPKWRKIDFNKSFSSDSSSDNEEKNPNEDHSEMRMYRSRFTQPMKSKIQNLPLPQILKNYLNFYREF